MYPVEEISNTVAGHFFFLFVNQINRLIFLD